LWLRKRNHSQFDWNTTLTFFEQHFPPPLWRASTKPVLLCSSSSWLHCKVCHEFQLLWCIHRCLLRRWYSFVHRSIVDTSCAVICKPNSTALRIQHYTTVSSMKSDHYVASNLIKLFYRGMKCIHFDASNRWINENNTRC
jgi:hypothetical protein